MYNAWFVGKILNRNIYTKQGSLLLPKGSIITEQHLLLLQQHDIDLWKEDIELATELLVDYTVDEVETILIQILNKKVGSSHSAHSLIRNKVLPKLYELCNHHQMSHLLMALSKKDNYTYRHCVAVGVLSLLIGKWLSFPKEKREGLAIAGLLHDVGKIRIPDAILSKSSQLNDEEYRHIQLHTQYGYEIIRSIPMLDELPALVALQHHEREDGSGYPEGLMGDQILYQSKIVAVADVFHSMISKRVYKAPVPLYQVFQEIYQKSFGLFDPETVHTFIKNMMNRLIGDRVLLSDGRIARIVMLYPDDLIHPLVEAHKQFYDLRRAPYQIVDFVNHPLRLAE